MKNFYLIFFLAFLAISSTAQPISDLNGTTVTGNIVTSLTITGFSVPANNDRLLVACTENASNAAAPTLTFAGNPMTLAHTRSSTSGLRLAVYYIPLGTSGSATSGNIVASGSSLLQIGATSFHDVDQIDPTSSEVNNTFFGGVTSNSITVISNTNSLVFDCIGAFASLFSNFTVDPSQTQLFQSNASSPNTRIACSIKPGAASVNMSWTINGDFTGGTGVQIGMSINPVSVLPIELTFFKGISVRSENQLFWQTASEKENTGFEIQRSGDGHQWEALDFVAGRGTTAQTENYNWTDRSPLSGVNYYRLKQVDMTGEFDYSDIIQLSTGENQEILVYPNPAGEELFYQVEAMESVQYVRLLDTTGKLVQEAAPTDGRLSLMDLPSGWYWLVVQTNSGMKQQRVFKR